MEASNIELGMRVKVTGPLASTAGMMIKKPFLDARRVGAFGHIRGYVPGHGGDVWWVEHEDDGYVGAYLFTEIEPFQQPENPDAKIDLLLDS